MKHLSFLLDDEKSYQKAVKKAKKEKYTSQLIQIFTSNLDIDTSANTRRFSKGDHYRYHHRRGDQPFKNVQKYGRTQCFTL